MNPTQATHTSQEQISDSVVRKIQLLLNLAAKAEGNEAEAAKNARYWDRQCAKEDTRRRREAARRDHGAYRAGTQTAEKIGLDGQLRAGKPVQNFAK